MRLMPSFLFLLLFASAGSINGTPLSPSVAQLMRRTGRRNPKMVIDY